MIITRSPLRVSLGGGGTDLPSYYEPHEGFVVAAAIDKYVYIAVHRSFAPEIILKYSKLERVQNVDQIEHTLIREAIRLSGVKAPPLEIASMADIPAGTGLGSSGSFTTALLKGLHAYNKNLIHPEELAKQACHIEIDLAHSPIGKQDQYIAAFGGITCFLFKKDGRVEASPLRLPAESQRNLEDNLVLFFTGYTRQAAGILKDQDVKSRRQDKAMLENLHFMKETSLKVKEALEAGDFPQFASLLSAHWEHKKKRSSTMSNPEIDRFYDIAMKNGALGGKLIGAGGGGFLMFYAGDKARLCRAMKEAGLLEVRFRFDFEGTKVVVS